MEKDEVVTIPYAALEYALHAAERQSKRLIVVIIILIVALVGSSIYWVYKWNEYDYVSDDYSIDAEQDGNLNIVSAGDVDYGTESESKQTENIENAP